MLSVSTFRYEFSVDASLEAVAAVHRNTGALKKLSPPPMIVQLHRIDPMAEGAISEFTLWLGPIPIRWRAVHSQVSVNGFTDSQENGPMAFWAHTHHFETINDTQTRIHERIEYTHPVGLRGFFTRLLFGKLGSLFLFSYRAWATKRALE